MERVLGIDEFRRDSWNEELVSNVPQDMRGFISVSVVNFTDQGREDK